MIDSQKWRPGVTPGPPIAGLYLSILEPSVAQPPLPLQEFLPLQPLSLLLQPPLPLQEFCPLQACFSFFAFSVVLDCPAIALIEETVDAEPSFDGVAALTRVIVPPSSPVMAAVSTREPLDAFISNYLLCSNLSKCYGLTA